MKFLTIVFGILVISVCAEMKCFAGEPDEIPKKIKEGRLSQEKLKEYKALTAKNRYWGKQEIELQQIESELVQLENTPESSQSGQGDLTRARLAFEESKEIMRANLSTAQQDLCQFNDPNDPKPGFLNEFARLKQAVFSSSHGANEAALLHAKAELSDFCEEYNVNMRPDSDIGRLMGIVKNGEKSVVSKSQSEKTKQYRKLRSLVSQAKSEALRIEAQCKLITYCYQNNIRMLGSYTRPPTPSSTASSSRPSSSMGSSSSSSSAQACSTNSQYQPLTARELEWLKGALDDDAETADSAAQIHYGDNSAQSTEGDPNPDDRSVCPSKRQRIE